MLRKFIFILAFVLALPSCVSAQSVTDTLVFATYQYASNTRVKNIEPFATLFSERSGAPVKVVSYASPELLIKAMVAEKTDFVFINTFGYLLLEEQTSNYAIAAALHLPEKARSTYQTILVANRRGDIRTFSDIRKNSKRLSLLLVNPGSTSGNLIPRLKLADEGIVGDSAFQRVVYTKNHAQTLRDVISGKGDIGAFGTEEFYRLQAESPAEINKVCVIWESDPIPLGPALYRKGVNAKHSALFEKLLLNLHQISPNALESIKQGWTEAIPADYFHKVEPSYYTSLLSKNPNVGMQIVKAFAK